MREGAAGTTFAKIGNAARPGRGSRPLLVAWALFVLLFPVTSLSAEKSPLRIGDVPPKATLADLQGVPVTIPDGLRGKVVILHFWTDWCNYCLVEMPALESLYNRYREQGLVVVAVNVGQQKEAVEAFLAKVQVTYPVLLDAETKVSRAYGVLGVPRTFFLDRAGAIRFRVLGDASEETLHKLVRKMM